MKMTIKDIAEKAGVSTATVSLALNHKKGVSEETRQNILDIAREAGYTLPSPNNASKDIRFIVYKHHGYVVSDTPFFSSVIEGIEGECTNQGYQLMVSHVNRQDQGKLQEIIRQDSSAGWLLLATEMDLEDLEAFKGLRVPIVLLDSYFRHQDFDCVLIHNSDAAYKGAAHLIEKGHTHIGYLHSSIDINNFLYRKAGLEEALANHHLTLRGEDVFLLEPTMEGAYRDMKALVERFDASLPSAFFADNDIIAFGAMRALKEKGIRIPQEVSIVGFDDMPFCEISNPRLTTIKVFKQEMGNAAVRRLVQKIEGQDSTIQKIEVGTQLVIRDSVSVKG